MGEKCKKDLASLGVEGEAGVSDVGGWRLREDTAKASAGERSLRRVFSPDFDLIVCGDRGEVAVEGSGDPLDLSSAGQIVRSSIVH